MKKFFLYDPENGFDTYETVEDVARAAEESIPYYLDGTWDDNVDNLVTGVITHTAQQTDIEYKPEDPKVVEDWGWPEHIEYTCNYKMLPVEPPTFKGDGAAKQAMDTLTKCMVEDTEFAQNWHAIIAAKCYDSMRYAGYTDHDARSSTAYDAASRFMKVAFNLDVKV